MVPSNSRKSWNEKLEFWHHLFVCEGKQWAFCGASTSSPNKRASLDEEAKTTRELEESTSLEIDNKKWWRVTQLKKRLLLISEGRETRKKEEWAVKEGSLPQRRRKMSGPLDSTKDLSLLQGSHQHLYPLLNNKSCLPCNLEQHHLIFYFSFSGLVSCHLCKMTPTRTRPNM